MATRNPSLNIRPDLASPAFAAAVAAKDADGLTGPRPNSWWTGLHPTKCPGFDPKEGVLHSLPLPNTCSYTRQSVLDYFDNCWTLTEVCGCSDISPPQPFLPQMQPLQAP